MCGWLALLEFHFRFRVHFIVDIHSVHILLGGVLAKYMGKYDWYEEYPTTPASFVLNGFIYSLLGLYDLNATAPRNLSHEAGHLYEQGMASLKKMLLMYDTGSGSIYDLRHITLGEYCTYCRTQKTHNDSCNIQGVLGKLYINAFHVQHT